VYSTFDGRAQTEATRVLTQLGDAAYVEDHGLAGSRLLSRGDPKDVTYAFLLYERTARGNVVRVQADNVDAPFSPIAGAKLELGSTAKLRTLVSYLEAIERAYREQTSEPRRAPRARRRATP
jgi:membrane peptidoglycan carboxypeptidase